MRKYGRFAAIKALFAEKIAGTITVFLEESAFENGNANWMDEKVSVTKKYSKTEHS